ncbi:trypsin-like serine protease [Streptomyces sp. 3214.6]|uniref:trypsin-like serine protease n=1 Tax=Streptomyces sp. 3214.6 TaxID=1882757 RepID=UPI00090C55D5|nr:trypsin-like serine protease [Streptomyces sp. 3214.6]SHI17311.1 Secreted trypsin-like serine protease [Streptomyces sp. 3214.6]
MTTTGKRSTALAALVTVAVIGAPALSAHAVSGKPETDTSHAYTARLDIGGGAKACSAALIAPQWLATSASCFADNPAASVKVPAGAPKLKTTATIGRTDLTTTAGAVREVVQLVPRDDRDLVLARLSAPVAGIALPGLATAAPAKDSAVSVTGYGRTKDEWAPLKLHGESFQVDQVNTTDLAVHGASGAAICAGDSGAPVFTSAGLLGVASRSDQGGCFGTDPAQTSTAGVVTRTDDIAAWVRSTTESAPFADFNGDGVEDTAVGDPKATIGGDAEAGAVHVVYGGGKGTAELDQGQDVVPGDAEAGDRFGYALATVDYNKDGYTDLAVSSPYEDAGSIADVGMVSVIYGSPAGLGKGRASDNYAQGEGNGALKEAGKEKGDLLGFSLAAGITRDDEPFIVIGDPGEDVGDKADAGSVVYVHGNTNVWLSQNAGLPGSPEAGDRVGTSVAADMTNIVIGEPGEDIGDKADAGGVAVLTHNLGPNGKPIVRAGLDQNSDKISGGAEKGDEMGKSVAIIPKGTNDDSLIVVGAPGESIVPSGSTTNVANAGSVFVIDFPAKSDWSQQAVINQDQPNVVGGVETGDRFGETLAAVNLAPGKATPGWADLQLAVGVPGESQGSVAGAGSVQTFSLVGAPGNHNDVLYAGYNKVPGTPGAGQHLGQYLAVSPTHVSIGMPNGPQAGGAVYQVPWNNVTSHASSADADENVTVLRPGTGGIPAGGKAFGWVIQ